MKVVRLLVLTVTCLFLVTACFEKVLKSTTNKDVASNKAISYLALGDSYTAAAGIEPSSGYPYQLSDRIYVKDSITVTVEVQARNGWTTRDLLNSLKSKEYHNSFDVVSLLIGVNNQYQKQDFDFYAEELMELLDSCKSYVGRDNKQIIVLSIPDYGYTPFGNANQPNITAELDRYNSFTDSVCTVMDISYYNITDISRQAEYSKDLIAPDSLHPSAMQYKLWIDRHYNDLVEKFK